MHCKSPLPVRFVVCPLPLHYLGYYCDLDTVIASYLWPNTALSTDEVQNIQFRSSLCLRRGRCKRMARRRKFLSLDVYCTVLLDFLAVSVTSL